MSSIIIRIIANIIFSIIMDEIFPMFIHNVIIGGSKQSSLRYFEIFVNILRYLELIWNILKHFELVWDILVFLNILN
jgi:hypothetical protein